MVAASLLITNSPPRESHAESIARRMAYVREGDASPIIVTPVLYPSGRAVGVRLLGGPENFTVTDDGGTINEAEMIGAADLCREEARKVAERYQLRFNQWELFEAEAPAEMLPAFVAIVANAAAETMIRTADALTRRISRNKSELLAERLERIFGTLQVKKHPLVHGSSTKEWRFDASVVTATGKRALFTLVTPAAASVTWAYAKMDDVSRVEDAPLLAAVLDGRLAADDRALIGRAARQVLSATDADDVFRRAA